LSHASAAHRAFAIRALLKTERLDGIRVIAVLRDNLGFGAEHGVMEGLLCRSRGIARGGKYILCAKLGLLGLLHQRSQAERKRSGLRGKVDAHGRRNVSTHLSH